MAEIRNVRPRGGFGAWKMDATNQWMEWGTHALLSDKAVYLPHLLLPHSMYYLCRATVYYICFTMLNSAALRSKDAMEIRAEKELKVLTYFNPVGLEPQWGTK